MLLAHLPALIRMIARPFSSPFELADGTTKLKAPARDENIARPLDYRRPAAAKSASWGSIAARWRRSAPQRPRRKRPRSARPRGRSSTRTPAALSRLGMVPRARGGAARRRFLFGLIGWRRQGGGVELGGRLR